MIMGQVLQAGQGQITARQAAVKAGIPMSVPGDHDQQGVPLRHQRDLPRRPDDAGGRRRGRRRRRHGVDDQRAVPAAQGARRATAWATASCVDSLIHDGLWCAFDAVHMGAGTEKYTGNFGGLTREMQDEFAAKSHERAAAAMKEGRFADEIVAGLGPAAQGRPGRSSTRTRASAPAPPPSRSAGSAPRSRRTAPSPPATRRRSPTARAAVDRHQPGEGGGARRSRRSPSSSASAWSPAPTRRCSPSRRGRSSGRSTPRTCRSPTIDLFELNEAFAAVGLASDAGPRHHRRHRQRQRRRDRARPPGRHVGHPRRDHAHQRAAPPRWRRSVRPPSAAAAARATPPSSGRCSTGTGPTHARSGHVVALLGTERAPESGGTADRVTEGLPRSGRQPSLTSIRPLSS